MKVNKRPLAMQAALLFVNLLSIPDSDNQSELCLSS